MERRDVLVGDCQFGTKRGRLIATIKHRRPSKSTKLHSSSAEAQWEFGGSELSRVGQAVIGMHLLRHIVAICYYVVLD